MARLFGARYLVETLSVSSYSSKYGLFVWTSDPTAASETCAVVSDHFSACLLLENRDEKLN